MGEYIFFKHVTIIYFLLPLQGLQDDAGNLHSDDDDTVRYSNIMRQLNSKFLSIETIVGNFKLEHFSIFLIFLQRQLKLKKKIVSQLRREKSTLLKNS